MDLFNQDIKFLAGVGPKRADLLAKELDIHTPSDLLRHFPYKYIDRSRFYYLHEISDEMPFVQVKGEIIRFEKVGEGRKQRLKAIFSDGHSTIDLVWFQGVKYVTDNYKSGIEYVLFGKPTVFNGKYNIVHPELELASTISLAQEMGLQPYYNTTEKMKSNFLNSKALQKIIYPLVKQVQTGIPETLPAYILKKYVLMNLTDSMVNVHFPQNPDLLHKARQRLKFEELFYIQLSILQQKKWREEHFTGFIFDKVGDYFNTFYKNYLKFELTNAQKRVIREIRGAMATGKQMNRLLQGDVGSGKTLVALMCMLIAVDNGFQACIMAPTEILANQHFESIMAFIADIGLHVALLTGSTKKKERDLIYQKLFAGEIQILIGTHALIEDTVQFKNLGFVVIDEQHRFGVEQRSKLWKKNQILPHVLVMTATPIPRTLAMTVYGDLSVSVIDELPPGRKPVQTFHYYDNKRSSINQFIEKKITEGRQVYVVYPLIQESEKIDLQNLEDGYKYTKEVFPAFKISMIHGKMKPTEKDEHMRKFVEGETQILVATTVIEVGVNVPNASVMIIESAQRFGLSQLHQLRGRVGRGSDQSYCILLTNIKLSKDTRRRIDIMVQTNDGFEISEADLKLRGPGDMDGTKQSGFPFELHIANITKDGELLEIARSAASEVLDEDPNLRTTQNFVLSKQLKKMKTNTINWGMIS